MQIEKPKQAYSDMPEKPNGFVHLMWTVLIGGICYLCATTLFSIFIF